MVRMAAISSLGFALPSFIAGFIANKPVAGCAPGAGAGAAGSNSFLANCGVDCGGAFFLFCPGGGVRGFGSARGSRPLARRSSAWRWRIAATDIFLGGGAPRPPPCVFVFGGVLGGGRAVPGADRGRSGAGSPPIRTTTSGESSHPGFPEPGPRPTSASRSTCSRNAFSALLAAARRCLSFMRSKKLGGPAGGVPPLSRDVPPWSDGPSRSRLARSSASWSFLASPRNRAAASFSVCGASSTPARNLRSTPVTGLEPLTFRSSTRPLRRSNTRRSSARWRSIARTSSACAFCASRLARAIFSSASTAFEVCALSVSSSSLFFANNARSRRLAADSSRSFAMRSCSDACRSSRRE
mmetsp:Transcript_5900/g.26113  ORF Transcript_5900/g.26113 Transcript_5900/m.26113 type:complete len:354 (+) Transcript_5900:1112-2173(+)